MSEKAKDLPALENKLDSLRGNLKRSNQIAFRCLCALEILPKKEEEEMGAEKEQIPRLQSCHEITDDINLLREDLENKLIRIETLLTGEKP